MEVHHTVEIHLLLLVINNNAVCDLTLGGYRTSYLASLGNSFFCESLPVWEHVNTNRRLCENCTFRLVNLGLANVATFRQAGIVHFAENCLHLLETCREGKKKLADEYEKIHLNMQE